MAGELTTDTREVDDPLEQLLADVHRMADGVTSIHALAVEFWKPLAAPAPSKLTDTEARAMDAIERLLVCATQDRALHVSVASPVLAIVYRIAAEAAARR